MPGHGLLRKSVIGIDFQSPMGQLNQKPDSTVTLLCHHCGMCDFYVLSFLCIKQVTSALFVGAKIKH